MCIVVTPYVYIVCWLSCVCGDDTVSICGMLASSSVCWGHTMCVCGVLGFPCGCVGHTLCICTMLAFLCVSCVGFPACVVITPCVYEVELVSLRMCGGHTMCACGVLTFLCVWYSHQVCIWCVGIPRYVLWSHHVCM